MLPRRSLRLRQQNGHSASTSAASSSPLPPTDETSKSIDKTAKKRARSEPSLDIQGVNQPKQKKMKLSVVSFESFPNEVLEEIFIRTDDIGLLNLADISTRFESIAQTAFSKRYADNYFFVNGEEVMNGDRCSTRPEIYAVLFNRFGSHIKAIQLNHIEDFDSSNWTTKLLQPHIDRIEKLTFNACTFKLNNIVPQALSNVTHLAFRDVSFGYNNAKFDLPECRNLTELEIRGTYNFTNKSLEQTIRNNPALQRVILSHCGNIEYGEHDIPTINVIAEHLKNIKELVLVDEYYRDWETEPFSVSEIDKIVDSFKYLESLSINIIANLFEPLQRLAKECKSLKHLGLFRYGNEINELDNETIRSFQQIESLYLTWDFNDFTPVDLPVENLSNLRHLSIEMDYAFNLYNENKFSNVLPLFRKSESLQHITMAFKDDYAPIYPEDFNTTEFFEKFIETINVTGKSNVRIEVEENGKIIGIATEHGIIWRNKLMNWMSCNKNDTNIHLLDLADHPEKSDETKNAADQTNLLDRICDYLDLGSLATLAEMNERSERLVNNYVEKHAKKQKTFNITDKFNLSKFFDGQDYNNTCHIFKKLKHTQKLTDLNVCILNDYNIDYVAKMIENCALLNKLSIYSNARDAFWPQVQTNLSQIVYDSSYSMNYSELINIIRSFANVETIECKNAGFCYVSERDMWFINKGQKFGKLKKFIFNYRGEIQMKNLQKIFKCKTVQLVPIYS